jgi:pimeloyl-ACP methyl ester carboxylesterase
MRYAHGARCGFAGVAALLIVLGAAAAQDRKSAPEPDPKGKSAEGTKPKPAVSGKMRKGGLRVPAGAPPKKAQRGDPLAKAGADDDPPKWPYRWKLKIAGADGQPLAATFYPSRAGAGASVLLMVHDRGTGHSSQEFEEPIAELQGQGLAEHMQELDYAVLLVDLRGHGGNPRAARELTNREWANMVGDLQAAYLFLVDRHNRRELNLAKLGIVAVGEGANLVTAWAAAPGGAVSSEGRVGDISGLVLVSPAEDSLGLNLASAVAALAPRIPILLMGGDRDTTAANLVKPVIERQRLSKVILFKTRVRGDRLLRFEPKVVGAISKFLEEPVKFRSNSEWEPRYLLTPTAYSDIELVRGTKTDGAESDGDAPKSKARTKTEPAKPK